MATNPTYKPSEGKREEFRRYLEKTGVMDALTKVLVLLYEEPDKPDDALLYIQNSLATQSGNETPDELKNQIVELKGQIEKLQEELNLAKGVGEEIPPPEDPVDAPVEGLPEPVVTE